MISDETARQAPFWERGWFWLLIAAASTLPFVVSPLPMMPDYFTHTARYHIMNHGAQSPFLSRYFDFHWSLIGNLGVDLVMVPLGLVLPTEPAARLAAALIPPLTVWGIHAVAKGAWGKVPPTALLALPFLWTFSFIYGFVNYHLGVALALLVLALWMRLPAMSAKWRYPLFAVLAMVVWIAHVAAWGGLLVMVGMWELTTQLRSADSPLKAMWTTVLRALPLLLPLVFILLWRAASAGTADLFSYDWRLKMVWPFVVLKAENKVFDIACVGVLAGITAWLLVSRRTAKDVRLLAMAAGLAGAYLAMPTMLFNSFFADERLLPVLAIVLVLSVAPLDRRQGMIVALVGLALFGVRLAAISVGWHQRAIAAQQDLRALDQVPQGSRIAALAVTTYCGSWQMRGFEHLASLAIIRRDAFTNTQWDTPGAQLMHPAYNKGRPFNELSSVTLGGGRAQCAGPSVVQSLAALPRDRFDYVWIFDQPEQRLPWLRQVFHGPDGRLYAIRR